MAVVFKKPVQGESLAGDGDRKRCPTLSLVSGKVPRSLVQDFVFNFVSYFYGIDKSLVHGGSDFVEDLERFVYTKGGTVPLEYDRFFVDPDDEENSGVSDKGLSFFLFCDILFDALGMELRGEEGSDDDEDAVFNSSTVQELMESLEVLLKSKLHFTEN